MEVLIYWREQHAGQQSYEYFGLDWAEVLKELHSNRPCDCCAPMAFASNGAKAWVEDGEVVCAADWE